MSRPATADWRGDRLPTAVANSADLRALLADAPLREGQEGEVLYREGDRADVAYVVDGGLVKLCFDLPNGRERTWNLAGPGDWIGALGDGHEHHVDRAVILGRRLTYRAILTPFDPALQPLAARASVLRSERLLDAFRTADLPSIARLAQTLGWLARRFGHEVDGGRVRVTLPLTHETLAGLTGCARETTTTLMSDLKRAHVLEGTRGRYVVDLAHLDAVAHGATDPGSR